MNKKNERLFLSFFEKLVEDKDNSKYINNIIEFIDSCNSLDGKNRVNGEAEDQKEPKSSSKVKEIIKNRSYLYKLVKNEHDYLQYTLDRLVKGISSGVKNSRSGFGDCLREVLKKYEDSVDFDNLIQLFLSVYSSSGDFVLNKQVKYIYLGRLEIILQLYRLKYFKKHKTEHIEKIVEYILEAYSNKAYLQDSSAILLMMVLSDLHNGNKEAYESVMSKFSLKDNNPSMLSLNMFMTNLGNKKNGSYKGAGMIEDDVLFRALDEMKNYYPILSVYIYFLVERMKKDGTLFEKVVNVLNYLMESNSFNAVKVSLITLVIGIFEVKNEHVLKIVFDKLKVYLKTVVKYYRYANSTSIKKFINNYLIMLSNMFNEGLLMNKGTFNPYIFVYSSLSQMDVISEEVAVYVEMHKKLIDEFFKRVGSERTDVMKEVKKNLSNDENDRIKAVESGIRYELLMKIGECVNIYNINILNPVIKSILFSISQNSVEEKEAVELSNISIGETSKFEGKNGKNGKNKGNNSKKGTDNVDSKGEMKRLREVNVSKNNEMLCMKLFEEFKRDENKFNYLLYLLKLLIIDNFYNLTLLSNYISNEYKPQVRSKKYDTKIDTDVKGEQQKQLKQQHQQQGIKDVQEVEGLNKEHQVLELYSILLVKYLGNLENKFNKLSVNDLNNYYTILVAQVNSFYQEEIDSETDNSVFNIRNKFLVLVKTKSTKYSSSTDVDDKRILMDLIVMIAVCLYLVLLERECVEVDKMLLDYISILYKYFNNEVSDEENRQLHYLSLYYTFNNSNSTATLTETTTTTTSKIATTTTTNPEVKGKQLESMFELVNGLVWRQVSQELDEELCKTILKTTLTCDLNVLNSLSNVDYSMDDSSEEDDDDDDDDDDMDEDEEESVDDEDVEMGEDDSQDDEKEDGEEQENDESDDDQDEEEHGEEDDEEGDDGDDVILNDYDKIYDELTTKSEFTFDRKKIKEEHSVKEEQYRIKEAGYSLLLNLVENDNSSNNIDVSGSNKQRIESVLSLSDVLELLDDYVKSTKFNYNSKISKLIKELSKTKQIVVSNGQNKEELNKSKKSKKTLSGSSNNNSNSNNNNNNNSNNSKNSNNQDFDVDSNVEMINKIINILLYNRNSRGVLVNVVEIVSKIVNNTKLITVIVNYMVFLVLTKRTNVNVNIMIELYKKYKCMLNMFKILEVLSKNVMKSQLLIFSSKVIEMNKYYNSNGDEVDLEEYMSKIGSDNFRDYVSNKDVKEDLNILLNHVIQFNETSTITESSELTTSESVSSQVESKNSNSPKRVKIDKNKKKNKGEYSSQYVKAIVVSINTMYHYVNKNSIHVNSSPDGSSKSNNISPQNSKSKSKKAKNTNNNTNNNNNNTNNNNNNGNNSQGTISATDEIFNKIKVKVTSIQNKQLKKYFNNIAIK